MTTVINLDEERVIRERFWHPVTNDHAVDVGSYQGVYTIPALQNGAYVTAIDARAHTLDLIPDHPRLFKVHAAIYNGLRYPPELIADIENGPHESSRDMIPNGKWMTLDSLLAGKPVDWVKIDVEGGELGVLQGAVSILRRQMPRLLIEDHTRVYPWVAAHKSTERIFDLLQRAGYKPQLIMDTYPDYIVA